MRNILIKKILVPTDFSDTASNTLQHAVNMAKYHDATIILHHVLSTFSSRVNLPEIIEIETIHNSRLSGAVGSKLENLAADLGKTHGMHVETIVSAGRVREEVVRVSREINADMIIMGTHGVSGFKEFFIGSNAFRVVMEADCPVLSIQKSARNIGFKNIVVPIDNSMHSREKIGFSVHLARLFDSRLHICGLRSHDHEDEEMNSRFRLKMKSVIDFLKEKEIDYSESINFCSNIAQAVLEFSIQQQADLIIIMNEQEINDTGFFQGAYAQQIVNHSKIPVLSIRPDVGYLGNFLPY